MGDLLYYTEHLERCIRIDRVISIFQAIATSSAIASWVIWQHLGPLWAIIVAASQVLTVVSSYLPYKKRIKQINSLKDLLAPLYNEMESKIFSVCSGELSDVEINKLQYELMKRWTTAQGEFFDDDILPENKNFRDHANKLRDIYFERVLGHNIVSVSVNTPQVNNVIAGGVSA